MPEAPIGYTHTGVSIIHRIMVTCAPSVHPGLSANSVMFQYIDSRLLGPQGVLPQQVPFGQQVPPGQQVPSTDSSPAPPPPTTVPEPSFAQPDAEGRFHDCGVIADSNPAGITIRADAEPRYDGGESLSEFAWVCSYHQRDLQSGVAFYKAWTRARKPAEYAGGAHDRRPGAKCSTIDDGVLAFMKDLAKAARLEVPVLKSGWPEFGDTISHYIGRSGKPWTVPVSKLLDDIPAFRREVDRLQIAARFWAAKFYRSHRSIRRFVLIGPFGLYIVPGDCDMNWFGALDAFAYWYVGCVTVSGGGGTYESKAPVTLSIEFQLNVADHYEFQGTPRIPKLRAQIRLPSNDDGDGGDMVFIPETLKAAIEQSDLFGFVSFPAELMIPGYGIEADICPRYITTKRFLSLQVCGHAAEFDSYGSWRSPDPLRVRIS